MCRCGLHVLLVVVGDLDVGVGGAGGVWSWECVDAGRIDAECVDAGCTY